jgi:CO dehydrogenase maturation factor
VVIDNEAGMEHISRQTTADVDTLLIISNPTVPGVRAAIRTQQLIHELRSNVKRVYLVLNRVTGELTPTLEDLLQEGKIELLESIPEDPYIGEFEAEGKPVTELPEDSPLKKGAREILSKLRFISEPASA